MKTCTHCKIEKESHEFNKHKTTSDKLTSWCKACVNKAGSDWSKENTIYINSLKTPCVVCGEARTGCIDWHHIDPSTKERTPAHLRFKSKEFIKGELDKCICVCSNCHRLFHQSDDAKVQEIINGYRRDC